MGGTERREVTGTGSATFSAVPAPRLLVRRGFHANCANPLTCHPHHCRIPVVELTCWRPSGALRASHGRGCPCRLLYPITPSWNRSGLVVWVRSTAPTTSTRLHSWFLAPDVGVCQAGLRRKAGQCIRGCPHVRARGRHRTGFVVVEKPLQGDLSAGFARVRL